MIKRGAVLFLMFILLVIPLSLAETNVKVNIRAKPGQNLVLRLLDPTTFAVIDSLYLKANLNGNATGNFSTNRASIDMTILVVKDGIIKETHEKLGPFSTNEPIFISILDDEAQDPTPVTSTEVTVNITENTTNESEATADIVAESQDASGITGAAITVDDASSFFQNITTNIGYYIIILAILLGVLGLMIVRRFKSSPIKEESKEKIKVTKLSDFREKQKQEQEQQAQQQSEVFIPQDTLADAEKKLKEAQAEIEQLKKQRQVEEAQKRFNQAKAELDKLRGDNFQHS
ncbi:MAG: hypothetical protein ABIH72_00100 [archaeon]